MAYDGLSELKAKRRNRPTRVIPQPSNPRQETKPSDPAVDPSAPDEDVPKAQGDTKQAVRDPEPAEEAAGTPTAENGSPSPAPLPRTAPATPRVAPPVPKGTVDVETAAMGSEPAHTRQLLVYLYPTVREAARKDANLRSVSNASIALDAVDACHQELGRLIKERSVDVRADSLFGPRPRVPSRRKVAGRGETRIPWSVQLLEDDIDVLKDLMRMHNAASISEVLSVALENQYGKGMQNEN